MCKSCPNGTAIGRVCKPPIEAKYGQPIEHWLQLVAQRQGMKHMEIVNWLKTEHGLGHGHANAIVAHALAGK